ncbi:Pyoverdine/dityrosine biosynthesis protein-domain-containing protein [Aspergillus karnatakaensis]|uniref:isocyanide synthase xanB n=1 Tax=Aspergillus karnatakaensis TaxID=1810916 RepID=UPI003CCDB1AA
MSINYGTSIYHHVAAIYQRDAQGTLLIIDGRYADQIRAQWSQLFHTLSTSQPIITAGLAFDKSITTTECIVLFTQKSQAEEQTTTQIHELQDPNSATIRGLVTLTPSSTLSKEFFNWSKIFLLLNARFLTNSLVPASENTEARAIAERITNLFEEILKNTSQDDRWLSQGGRQYFIDKVYTFTKDRKIIELCLPAFPCKSSNPNKVAGVQPDAAEHLALNHLHSFVEQVSRIYTPGATLWIISDGHVFSDNIGVDDYLVDEYGATLATQYQQRTPNTPKDQALIQFTGLEDLFFSSPESTAAFTPSMLHTVEIPQPVQTVQTERAQLCRLLLENVGGIDRTHLRTLIDRKDPDTVALYQGQSRFMLEDLGSYLSSKNIGNKQKKKIASLVAAEMIARNHAYSNLVELLFPHHIRLSIHAHNNSGPKFGIRLFPRGSVRPVHDFQTLLDVDGEGNKPLYEFQIPTPWHNTLVKVQGSGVSYLTRSSIARDAIASGEFEGVWVEGSDGGYFEIRRVKGEGEGEDTEVEAGAAGETESDTETLVDVNAEPVVAKKEPLKGAVAVKKKSVLRTMGKFVWDRILGCWRLIRAVV